MICLAVLAWATPAAGQASGEQWGELALAFLPGADAIGDPEGEPPAAPLLQSGQVVGYALLSDWIAPLPAYSGKPVSVLVVLDLHGRIRGSRIVAHEEPILGAGVREEDLRAFVEQYQGITASDDVRVGGQARAGRTVVDGISGATISVMVINSSIMRAARRVAQSRGLSANGADESRSTEVRAARSPRAAEPDTDVATIWRDAWQSKRSYLIALLFGLAVLALVLVLQDWLTRFPRALDVLRTVFLAYTLVFLGWVALAQLSIVNVFTFLQAIMTGFRWETFLIEPMIFTLWGFVAITLLLWGRGVYCGWLCPFGAFQELLNKAGKALGAPQLHIPELIHERLLAIKYVLAIVLFGLSLHSMPEAVRYAEVEPFKTAITLRFEREGPFIAYTVLLLIIAVFNGKFFCKYLCPLGAALAIPSKLRIFEWLRRRVQCGRPCQTCAKACPSQAIRATGEINASECHYCLDCQMTFWNAYKCPPLVERRKRAERTGVPVKLKL